MFLEIFQEFFFLWKGSSGLFLTILYTVRRSFTGFFYDVKILSGILVDFFGFFIFSLSPFFLYFFYKVFQDSCGLLVFLYTVQVWLQICFRFPFSDLFEEVVWRKADWICFFLNYYFFGSGFGFFFSQRGCLSDSTKKKKTKRTTCRIFMEDILDVTDSHTNRRWYFPIICLYLNI